MTKAKTARDAEARKILENLESGSVIKYYEKGWSAPVYFIVYDVKDGYITGQIADPRPTNSISIDRLLLERIEGLSIATKFKKI